MREAKNFKNMDIFLLEMYCLSVCTVKYIYIYIITRISWEKERGKKDPTAGIFGEGVSFHTGPNLEHSCQFWLEQNRIDYYITQF